MKKAEAMDSLGILTSITESKWGGGCRETGPQVDRCLCSKLENLQYKELLTVLKRTD